MEYFRTSLNLLMSKLFNGIKDFSSLFAIDELHGTNYQIIDLATKNEVLHFVVNVLKPFILKMPKNGN